MIGQYRTPGDMDFERALMLGLYYAAHWGVLELPEGKVVRLTNWCFRNNMVFGDPGLVTLVDSPDGQAGVALEWSTFEFNDLNVLDAVIMVVREALDME